MYTLNKGTELSASVLRDIIKFNDSNVARYNRLENYYIGNHTSILDRTKTDQGSSNHKLIINHAKYITDISIGYLLGNPVEYQAGKDVNLDPLIDVYKEQSIADLDTELATEVSILGISREWIYLNEDGNPRSAQIDPRNSILVYDDTVEHKELYGIMYRECVANGKKYTEVVVGSADKIVTYKLTARTLTIMDEQDNPFKKVPMIDYRNNSRFIGDYEPVLSLIDAYNLLQSDRVNDKEQLVEALLILYGLDLSEAQKVELKSGRMLSSVPTDAKIEYIYKTLQESDVDILRKNLEADIHKISLTPNMSDQNFVGNSSGVAIEYKLLPFEQHIKNKERYMEKGLIKRFELYNAILVTKSVMEVIKPQEIDVIFKRNLPKNDLETSQMINNLDGYVDHETLISRLSFIDDASEIMDIVKKEKENSPQPSYQLAFGQNELPDANDNQDIEEV